MMGTASARADAAVQLVLDAFPGVRIARPGEADPMPELLVEAVAAVAPSSGLGRSTWWIGRDDMEAAG